MSEQKHISNTEHSFLGRVVFYGMLLSISSAIFISKTSMKINKDFETGVILSFFIYPLLGVILVWQNSEPEKEGIFSKFKSLFTAGLWYSVLSAILLATANVSYVENGVNIYTYLLIGCAFLSLLISIGKNMRTNYSYRRGFGDALAMSMGQLIIVLLILVVLSALLNKKK